jgi:hypothetical protein
MNWWRIGMVCLVSVFTFSSAYAQTLTPLGQSHVQFKVDYFAFTEDDLEDIDADTSAYFGVEGYVNVSPNLYIGGEIGYADTDGSETLIYTFAGTTFTDSIDAEFEYIPVEFNGKYVIEPEPNLVIGFGGGLSFNHVDADVKLLFRTDSPVSGTSVFALSESDDEWLFGGQFFVDVNYKVDNIFFGANLKYQITEEYDDIDTDFSNFRIGAQIGLLF